MSACELLAVHLQIAGRGKQEDREKCQLEGVESLQRSTSRYKPSLVNNKLGSIVTYFKEGLRLMMAGKEGGFVIMPSTLYLEKACEAIRKDFVKVKPYEAHVKTKAVVLCKDLNLTRLTNGICSSKSRNLTSAFLVRRRIKLRSLSIPLLTKKAPGSTRLAYFC